MRVAKTIDELYDEVKDYDIVISGDASLVTALNNRIDRPMIGRLASTPKMIAKDHEDVILEKLMQLGICSKDGMFGIKEDVKLLETISEVTGYDVRFVHGEIENIRKIRKHTLNVEKFLYGKPSKKIYEAFKEQPTYEMVMSSFEYDEHEIFKGKRTAIIGLDMFDDLDKHFIPSVYDEIDLFKKGEHHIEQIYAVGNDRQVAEHAVDLITNEIAEDVAIVMNINEPIADAVRSALYRKGIAFKNTLSAKDIVNVRDYMEFIRKALSYETLTVGDVRELFASLGATAKSRDDEYLLNKYTKFSDEKFIQLSDLMLNIRDHTFSELCDIIVDSKHKGTVNMVLSGIDIQSQKINEKTESFASYLINSIEGIKHNAEIPDNEKKGVLLADCLNSVYIDRPFIIYLSINNGWSSDISGKDYTDREKEEENESQRFQILLQQGSVRRYIVNTMKEGKDARPCVSFDRLNIDENGSFKRIERFSDIVGTYLKKGAWLSSCDPVADTLHKFTGTVKELGPLSKTSMNRYIECPRAYMLGEFVSSPDSERSVFGVMMHQFAEFYACYPEIVKKNMRRCIERMENDYAGISCPEKDELDRTKISAAVMNMTRFIDSLNINTQLNVDISGKKKRKNIFFEMFSLERTSDIVETDRYSSSAPLHGEFDLLIGNKIIDHKTGAPKDGSKIVGEMDIDEINDHYEVQPLVYLSILDDIVMNGEKEFIQFYATDNEKDAFDTSSDIMRNTRTVTLLNMRKADMLRSGLILDLVTRTKSREFIKEFGPQFTEALLNASVDNAHKWIENDELFEKILVMQNKRTDTVKKAIKSAIELAGKYVTGRFIREIGSNDILMPKETIEGFKEYARTIHSKANEQQLTGFPYEPRKSCNKCNYSHMCTGGVTNDGTE
ncbi:MAG: PD-(D/E)XK nuclease family protein [Methanomassiliicoccaceae archaeon]|nr:PD-(D/E)XK nuclease family protein [Methanomassiliicoccaceae archaeon]